MLSDLLAGSPFAATLKGAKKPAIVGQGALDRSDGSAVSALASQIALSVGCMDPRPAGTATRSSTAAARLSAPSTWALSPAPPPSPSAASRISPRC